MSHYLIKFNFLVSFSTYSDHVNGICRSYLYHIRTLRFIRSSHNIDAAKAISSAIIGSRLHYFNALSTVHLKITLISCKECRTYWLELSSMRALNHPTLLLIFSLFTGFLYDIVFFISSLSSLTAFLIICLLSIYHPSSLLTNILNIPRSRLQFTDKHSTSSTSLVRLSGTACLHTFALLAL